MSDWERANEALRYALDTIQQHGYPTTDTKRRRVMLEADPDLLLEVERLWAERAAREGTDELGER